MSNYRKPLIIAVTFGAFLALDQWSKLWAEQTLGTPDHPIAVHIDSALDGKPVSEVLAMKIPGYTPTTGNNAPNFVVIDGKTKLSANTPVYGAGAPPSSGFYVFSRGRDLPPRRVFRSDQYLTERWLQAALPDKSLEEIRAAVLGQLADTTLAQFLNDRVPYLDAESAMRVAETDTFVFQQTKNRVSDDAVVHSGDILLVPDRKISIIPNFLQMTYAENPGAAWGFMASAPERFRHIFFVCISILAGIAMGGILFNLDRTQTLLIVSFSSILSGAAGNFIDRLRFHYVIDFIDMYVGEAHWPTYNVADIAISVGVILLLGELLFKKNSALFAPPRPATPTTADA